MHLRYDFAFEGGRWWRYRHAGPSVAKRALASPWDEEVQKSSKFCLLSLHALTSANFASCNVTVFLTGTHYPLEDADGERRRWRRFCSFMETIDPPDHFQSLTNAKSKICFAEFQQPVGTFLSWSMRIFCLIVMYCLWSSATFCVACVCWKEFCRQRGQLDLRV